MSQCGRCGLNHLAGVCRAINAKCLKCQRFGHFARVCRTRAITKERSHSLQMKLRKKRDTERMTAFLRRKDAANLPFNTLDGDELHNLCFNSLLMIKAKCVHRCKKEKEILKAKVSGLEASLTFLRVETNDVKLNVKSAEVNCQRLQKDNKELNSTLRKRDNRIKQMAAINDKNVTTIQRLESMVEDRNVECGKLRRLSVQQETNKHNLQDAEDKIRTLTESLIEAENQLQKERMWHTESIQNRDIAYRKMKETKDDQKTLIQICQRDISSLSFQISLLIRAPNLKHFRCEKCGSTRYHERDRCPASIAKGSCIYCNRHNHFSIFCKNSPLD